MPPTAGASAARADDAASAEGQNETTVIRLRPTSSNRYPSAMPSIDGRPSGWLMVWTHACVMPSMFGARDPCAASVLLRRSGT